MLKKFNYRKNKSPQHALHKLNTLAYGHSIQYSPERNGTKKIDKKGRTLI